MEKVSENGKEEKMKTMTNLKAGGLLFSPVIVTMPVTG